MSRHDWHTPGSDRHFAGNSYKRPSHRPKTPSRGAPARGEPGDKPREWLIRSRGQHTQSSMRKNILTSLHDVRQWFFAIDSISDQVSPLHSESTLVHGLDQPPDSGPLALEIVGKCIESRCRPFSVGRLHTGRPQSRFEVDTQGSRFASVQQRRVVRRQRYAQNDVEPQQLLGPKCLGDRQPPHRSAPGRTCKAVGSIRRLR